MYQEYLSRKVLLATDDDIYIGTLHEENGDSVFLKDARLIRRIPNGVCLIDVANNGLTQGRISQSIESVIVCGVNIILPLTAGAAQNLEHEGEWWQV